MNNNSVNEDVGDVDKYIKFKIGDDYDKKDILSWWKRNCQHFPVLSILAKYILGVPTSSVPSEELFNTVGEVYTKKRAALETVKGGKLVFLNKNPK